MNGYEKNDRISTLSSVKESDVGLKILSHIGGVAFG